MFPSRTTPATPPAGPSQHFQVERRSEGPSTPLGRPDTTVLHDNSAGPSTVEQEAGSGGLLDEGDAEKRLRRAMKGKGKQRIRGAADHVE